MRIIRQHELKFSIDIFPCGLVPSEVIQDNPEYLSLIEERLENNDNLAWLDIVVSIKAAGFTGTDNIGAISLPESLTPHNGAPPWIRQEIQEHRMFKGAEHELLENITADGWHARIAAFITPTDIRIDWQ